MWKYLSDNSFQNKAWETMLISGKIYFLIKIICNRESNGIIAQHLILA